MSRVPARHVAPCILPCPCTFVTSCSALKRHTCRCLMSTASVSHTATDKTLLPNAPCTKGCDGGVSQWQLLCRLKLGEHWGWQAMMVRDCEQQAACKTSRHTGGCTADIAQDQPTSPRTASPANPIHLFAQVPIFFADNVTPKCGAACIDHSSVPTDAPRKHT